MNSSASRASAIPPIPRMGIRTAWRHSYTIRTAMGLMAGPLRPPTMFESFGRRVSTSMTMARNVLTRDTASAPASSAARANDATSVTFGVSLGITGNRVTFRTALTTANVPVRLQPKVIPPSLMFGHEMLSSMAATPSASDRMRASSTYSSMVVPQMLTMTVACLTRSSGSFSSTNRWTPMPCSPMAFSMPAGVSTIRGGGWPSRAVRNSPLTATPPSEARSTVSAYSTPYPKQPLAAINGFFRVRAPIWTERSMVESCSVPEYLIPGQHRPGDARSQVMIAAVLGPDRHHATVTAAEAAAHDALDRDLTGAAVGGGGPGRGSEHRLGATCVDHHRRVGRVCRQPSLERSEDPAVFTETSVLGRQDELDAEVAKDIEVKELGRASSAVEQHRCDASAAKRLRERRERRESHAAGHHPRFRWPIDDGEGTAQRTETAHALARLCGVEESRRDADALVQQRDAGR